ncbi:Ornithine decarboxylase [Trichoplax sp. H2]|nr:Ornithine decarboxylase [Trichoplax sp. H2]|eukprot:RDD39984.1 Ornithine decarboxylase [Trichoplax sp. H2]
MASHHVVPLEVTESQSLQEIITQKANAVNLNNEDEAFYLVNIGDIIYKFNTADIRLTTALDVKNDNIIYSNPCKGLSHLKVALIKGITLMTFDSEGELQRIKRMVPHAKLLLRLKVDDSKAAFPLGAKYGVPFSRVLHLFKVARKLSLNVIGISFHVGSGCDDPDSFTKAIEKSKKAFNLAKEIGLDLTLLDIGGGYPGIEDTLFENVKRDLLIPRLIILICMSDLMAKALYFQICGAITEALDKYFPTECGVEIIAEPENQSHKESMECMYHINDGLHGSFLRRLFTKEPFIPNVLKSKSGQFHRSSIWGPTCNGLDCIASGQTIPEMEAGDWTYFENLGAYASAASSNFNGFASKERHYYISKEHWSMTNKEVKQELSRYFDIHFNTQ